MRKLIVTAAAMAALFVIGSSIEPAQAQTTRAAASIAAATQNFTPIEKAACRGWGRWCGPGYVRACGPFRCWCRPCR